MDWIILVLLNLNPVHYIAVLCKQDGLLYFSIYFSFLAKLCRLSRSLMPPACMLRDTSEVDDLIWRDVKRYVTSPRYLYMAYFCIYGIYIANLAITLHRLV